MAYAPCKNKNCSSYGKPHPNCKCYGGMAAGGDVAPYCSEDRAHRLDCKYFADGGDVHHLDVPKHQDPELSSSAYMANKGLHGLIKMGPEDSLYDYNRAVVRGHKAIKDRISDLFDNKKSDIPDTKKQRELIKDWVSRGGSTQDIQDELYNQQTPHLVPKGGLLHRNVIADNYPEQNTMLQAAKGNMSNYLNSIKPHDVAPRLAFDKAPDQTAQKAAYDKALHLAAHPLGILDEVQKGTIDTEHMKHFNGLHPQLNQTLQKKLTERITEAQLKNERPPHKIRQGLSLLMGTPLTGDLSPQNIQAAQAVFQTQKAANKPPPQKADKALKETEQSLLTPEQAAAKRQQKQ